MWSSFNWPIIWAVSQIAILVTASPAPSPPHWKTPHVKARNGTFAGIYIAAYDQDFFLGMPYAAPPVGNLRLRLPAPPEPWNGVKTADSYGPWCFGNSIGLRGFSQNTTGVMSEDCLHINIVRPSHTPKGAKLPVLVWIHGGGWLEGSANDSRYNGSFLVQNSVKMGTPIIFASFNYRLGLFGMMNGPAIEQAGLTNILLHDQRQALAWIQENIAAFGGDASRVTLMGESAGASSIGYHLVAYGGRDDGLFSAAIAESAGLSAFRTFRSDTERRADFNVVLNATGCTGAADALDCLRAVPAESLRRASSLAPASFTVDGSLLPDLSLRLLSAGRFVKVPLLIGSNRNEGTSFLQQAIPAPLNTPEDFTAAIKANIRDPPLREFDLQSWSRLYDEEIENPSPAGLGTVLPNPGPSFGPQYGKTTLWGGDFAFNADRRYANQLWADNGVPSYSFFFDAVTANVDAETLGVAHFQEIPFVFGNVDGIGWEVNPFPTEPGLKKKYQKLAEVMSRMWINFAVTRSPNFRKIPGDTVNWPRYTRENPTNIVFSVNNGTYLQPDTWRTEAMQMFIDLASELGNGELRGH